MQKIFVAFIFIMGFQYSQANIFIPSMAQISELLWDENGDWQLEISHFNMVDDEFNYTVYDSVVISTRDYRFKLSLPQLESTSTPNIFVLNKQLVGDSLDILHEGDSIHLETYGDEWAFNGKVDILVFGNYPGAKISKPAMNESIISIEGMVYRWFVISPNPSLGEINPLDGVIGTINGQLLVSENNPVFSHRPFGFDFEFKVNATGNFSTKLIKGDRKYTKIAFDIYYEGYYVWYAIEPLTISIEPGQIYENITIKITDSTFVAVQEEKEEKAYKIFPNPTSNQLNIASTDKNQDDLLEIVIYSMAGKMMHRFVENTRSIITINLNNKLPDGLYLLEIWEQKQLKHSERLIINAFK